MKTKLLIAMTLMALVAAIFSGCAFLATMDDAANDNATTLPFGIRTMDLNTDQGTTRDFRDYSYGNYNNYNNSFDRTNYGTSRNNQGGMVNRNYQSQTPTNRNYPQTLTNRNNAVNRNNTTPNTAVGNQQSTTLTPNSTLTNNTLNNTTPNTSMTNNTTQNPTTIKTPATLNTAR